MFNIINIEFLVALLCVYGNGSLLYVEHNQLFNTILILAFAILVINDSRVSALRVPNYLTFILILSPILSTLIKFSPLSNIVSLASITVLTLLMSMLSLDRLFRILNKYAEIILFLIIVSIVLSIMFYVLPAMRNLPLTDTSAGLYYDLFIYTHRYWEGFRVQSIYWEPGTWAINQAFCCFWFMFYKKNYKLYPVFFLSFILTMSTTGFILLSIITIALINESFAKFRIKYRLIYFMSPFALSLAFIFIIASRFDIDIKDYAFKYTIGRFITGSETSGSHEERLATTKDALEIANNNILLGNGKTAHLYVTSTIFDILYQYGYPFTLFYLILFWQLFRRVCFIFSVPFILVLLNGEVLSYFSLYPLLIILGTKIILIQNKATIFKRIDWMLLNKSSQSITSTLPNCNLALKITGRF